MMRKKDEQKQAKKKMLVDSCIAEGSVIINLTHNVAIVANNVESRPRGPRAHSNISPRRTALYASDTIKCCSVFSVICFQTIHNLCDQCRSSIHSGFGAVSIHVWPWPSFQTDDFGFLRGRGNSLAVVSSLIFSN